MLKSAMFQPFPPANSKEKTLPDPQQVAPNPELQLNFPNLSRSPQIFLNFKKMEPRVYEQTFCTRGWKYYFRFCYSSRRRKKFGTVKVGERNLIKTKDLAQVVSWGGGSGNNVK